MDREVLVRMKRALIVDDSKSARVVLSRVLEKLELAVDTTESAESALHYLRDHRPDVIFMDHVMSGMDGLQAVQAIKSDPSTASIPIMMYTSQDGELYAGEARALGAAGVLPKLMAPSDISRALDQLEILRGPREARIAEFEQVQLPTLPLQSAVHVSGAASNAAIDPATSGSAASPPPIAALTAAELGTTIAPLLRDQGTDLRRFVVAALEGFSSRVVTEVMAQVEVAAGRAATAATAALAPMPEPAPAPTPVAEPASVRRPYAWIALSFGALLATTAVAAYAWQQHGELTALRSDAEAKTHALADVRHDLDAARASAAAPADGGERLLVPYGEVPLAGDRLAALAKLVTDLEQRHFAALVTVTAGAGDFCLTGNPAEGYSPAPGEMPANRCDIVGNPFDEGLTADQRSPAALSALLAGLRERKDSSVDVVVDPAGRARAPNGYPAPAEVTAAQWNAAATDHNYVEFTVAPRHPGP
jgi:CheY-like chemotaxis protein